MIVTWVLNGYYRDNPYTDFSITYTAYYVDKGMPVTLSEYTYHFGGDTFNSLDWHNQTITHTLTGYNAIEGEELFLRIHFAINAHFHPLQKPIGDIDGGNFFDPVYFVRLVSVEYRHYESLGFDIP